MLAQQQIVKLEPDHMDEKTGFVPLTNHNILKDNSTDILITNYKMLDFPWMRSQDQTLWRHHEFSNGQFSVSSEQQV
jgi:ATP-dependent helicase YprA (DUF1998 family)